MYRVRSISNEHFIIPEYDQWEASICDNRAQSFTTGQTRLHPVTKILQTLNRKCNRGGNEQPTKGCGIRLPKSQGSCKMNRPCTAHIVSVKETTRMNCLRLQVMHRIINRSIFICFQKATVIKGLIHIRYFSEHFGHEMQLCHVNMSKSTRAAIAGIFKTLLAFNSA